ncbi:MAG: site-specific integrase [Pirellulales bacterium]
MDVHAEGRWASSGPVFNLGSTCRTKVGKTVSKIGQAALVSTAEHKWASAHDLRRAFGVYWASRVQPAVLMRLMRHSTIQTTMKYYVGQEIDSVFDAMQESEAPYTIADTSDQTEKTPQWV